jgi:sugar phosphate isomerase/epimerase
LDWCGHWSHLELKIMRIGLKLWSIDSAMISESIKLYKKKCFDYIELYVVPCTYDSTFEKWASFEGKFIIHCPHGGHGFNLADSSLRDKNQLKFKEVQGFANALKADHIIVHLGNNGSLDESILQLNDISDSRIFIENKPIEGLNGEKCIGSSPEDIKKVLQETHVQGFVLDFGHAIYASNTLKIDKFDFIRRFMTLKPKVFHFSDGFCNSTKDCHCNLGEGDFDLRKILSYIPQDSPVTLEISHSFKRGFTNFEENVKYLTKILVY